jgi:K+-transporting ATPase ATPase A chain
MTLNGWVQILFFALLIFAITKPLGLYMFRVFEEDHQPLPAPARTDREIAL